MSAVGLCAQELASGRRWGPASSWERMTPSNWSLILSCVHILCLGTSPSRSSVLRHAVINYSHCRLPRPRNNCGELHFIKRLLSYVLRGAFQRETLVIRLGHCELARVHISIALPRRSTVWKNSKPCSNLRAYGTTSAVSQPLCVD
ncbi:hypothetical protein K466DRAFT_37168 [Polyporus arcularius HHB13444]|uniref:Uncharacterized protein n=1 Tax=Polyporus arcularius HHB13444 TaxID=1314778 RepID=A0A5C3PLY5_9APHY|nr:hypothetical protein K466DRAFT_37168 [Polyporus arcularius HHB13444]